MRKYLIMCSTLFLCSACNNSLDGELAKERCDCYKEAMSFPTKTKQLCGIYSCYNWYQTDIEQLNLQLTESTLTLEQTQKELDKYKKIYRDCDCSSIK